MTCCHLLQVHTIAELERVLRLNLEGCMLGINNRDLGSFKVDLNNNKVIMESPAGQQVEHLIRHGCTAHPYVLGLLWRENRSGTHMQCILMTSLAP